MPKETPKTHTIESVEIVATRLEAIVAQIRVSKGVMEIEPPLRSIEVMRQNSLEIGLTGLRAWADALRDAVDDQRLEFASNGVSEDKPGTDKPRKKK
jgi:hypothetical protein